MFSSWFSGLEYSVEHFFLGNFFQDRVRQWMNFYFTRESMRIFCKTTLRPEVIENSSTNRRSSNNQLLLEWEEKYKTAYVNQHSFVPTNWQMSRHNKIRHFKSFPTCFLSPRAIDYIHLYFSISSCLHNSLKCFPGTLRVIYREKKRFREQARKTSPLYKFIRGFVGVLSDHTNRPADAFKTLVNLRLCFYGNRVKVDRIHERITYAREWIVLLKNWS